MYSVHDCTCGHANVHLIMYQFRRAGACNLRLKHVYLHVQTYIKCAVKQVFVRLDVDDYKVLTLSTPLTMDGRTLKLAGIHCMTSDTRPSCF